MTCYFQECIKYIKKRTFFHYNSIIYRCHHHFCIPHILNCTLQLFYQVDAYSFIKLNIAVASMHCTMESLSINLFVFMNLFAQFVNHPSTGFRQFKFVMIKFHISFILHIDFLQYNIPNHTRKEIAIVSLMVIQRGMCLYSGHKVNTMPRVCGNGNQYQTCPTFSCSFQKEGS